MRVIADEISYSLDYLFHLAVEMAKLGVPWVSEIEPTLPRSSVKA